MPPHLHGMPELRHLLRREQAFGHRRNVAFFAFHMGAVHIDETPYLAFAKHTAGASGNRAELFMQALPHSIHLAVFVDDGRREAGQQRSILVEGRGLQHWEQALFLVRMMPVCGLVKIFHDGEGGLARLLVDAVGSQVGRQLVQGCKLLADTVVAMLEYGNWLVKAGGAVGQSMVHGVLS